jgi:hypothetical protein
LGSPVPSRSRACLLSTCHQGRPACRLALASKVQQFLMKRSYSRARIPALVFPRSMLSHVACASLSLHVMCRTHNPCGASASPQAFALSYTCTSCICYHEFTLPLMKLPLRSLSCSAVLLKLRGHITVRCRALGVQIGALCVDITLHVYLLCSLRRMIIKFAFFTSNHIVHCSMESIAGLQRLYTLWHCSNAWT